MDDFVLMILEGKDMPTIKANFFFSFHHFLKDNFNFEVKNSIVYIIEKNTGNKIAELKSIVYDTNTYYMLLLSIPLDVANRILDEEFYSKIKNDEIYLVPSLKVISFIFNKGKFIEILNSFALNTVKFYRDNYESQNKKLILDDFPIIISYEKEYNIPVAIYNEAHKFEKYINRFVNEF